MGGYGELDYWGVHLHFELKDKPVTHNPSGPGTYWGYTPSNPDRGTAALPSTTTSDTVPP